MSVTVRERVLERVRRQQAAHPVPRAWQDRLRALAAPSDRLEGLQLAWEPKGQRYVVWKLTPAALVSRDRAAQLAVHYSALPVGQRMGRAACVTDYAFFCWHTRGCDARRLWVLQGLDHADWGGTPASYTPIEEAELRAVGAETAPPPIGSLPFQPFDERAVRHLRARDLLIRYQGDLGRGPTAGAQVDAAQRAYRQAFLGWWREAMAPKAAFLQWWMQSVKRAADLAPADPKIANAAAHWEDDYLATGMVPLAV